MIKTSIKSYKDSLKIIKSTITVTKNSMAITQDSIAIIKRLAGHNILNKKPEKMSNHNNKRQKLLHKRSISKIYKIRFKIVNMMKVSHLR